MLVNQIRGPRTFVSNCSQGSDWRVMVNDVGMGGPVWCRPIPFCRSVLEERSMNVRSEIQLNALVLLKEVSNGYWRIKRSKE